MISVNVSKPIHIKLPNIYRYMQNEYIDKFFDTGQLRISSFSRFKQYPDEVRGDKHAGSGMVSATGDSGLEFMAFTNVGQDGYMLSASLAESEEIQAAFGSDSYFIIHDPLGFSAAVLSSMIGTTQAFLGYCNYQSSRIIEKKIPELSTKDFLGPEGNFIIGGPGMAKRTDEMIGNGIDLMFLKNANYRYQAEFRFIWTLNTNFFKINEYLDVECKEAIQFCRRAAVHPLT